MTGTFLWFLLLVATFGPANVQADKKVPAGASSNSNQEELLSAEDLKAEPSLFYFEHKTVIIPHDEKKFRGGEDAASTSDRLLVVADGVGGWAKHDGKFLNAFVFGVGHHFIVYVLTVLYRSQSWSLLSHAHG
jgi:hypothetical protein